jgi:hypothetical protein
MQNSLEESEEVNMVEVELDALEAGMEVEVLNRPQEILTCFHQI